MEDCNQKGEMKKLCCIFNYPPLYRESIYLKIDNDFDTTFYFGNEVIEGKISGIKKLDYSIFKSKPIIIKNKLLFGRFYWRTGILFLPLKNFTDFLITGDIPLSYIPFLILCRILNKRVYAWGHGFNFLRGKSKYLIILFMKMLNGFFVYGEKGKARMLELGLDGLKMHIIYNSLSEGVLSNDDLKSDIYVEHFRNNNPILIFVGRITKSKKIDKILIAIDELRKENIFCNLILIGEGEILDYLKDISKNLNLDDEVWFYGSCYNESILKYLLYSADLCVSPGNVGLTAIHCMQYGVPVITHDNFENQGPEYEAIIEDETGLLYKYNDFGDMKEKIKKWLLSGKDRETIRQNCYRVINTHYNSNYQIKVLKEVIGG